jgi:flagellar biosynthesis protein FliR
MVMPATLEPILAHLPAFLLVLFRLTGLFIFAPMLAASVIPMRVKVLLALVLGFCIYPLIPPQPAIVITWGNAPFLAGGELLIGLAIGFGAALPLIAMQMAGQLMGQQLGIGLGEIFDPGFQESGEILGRLLLMIAMTLFLLMDGHHALLAVLIGSFRGVPLGGYAPDGQLLVVMTALLRSMLELAVRVAAPLLCLVLLEAIALGFVARTVPQLNILTVGLPLRLLLGMALIVVAIVAMSEAFVGSMRQVLVELGGLFGR